MSLPLESYAWTLFFTLSGLALMFVGLLIFDWIVPFKLFAEIEGGNEAVGWMAAGFLISAGIVLGQAFRYNVAWTEAMVDGALGVALNYLAYYLWEWLTPKWSLTQSLKNGSTAAGKVLFGIFVAIGLIIAGSFS